MHRLFVVVLAIASILINVRGAEAADYRLLRLSEKIVKWGAPHFRSGAALTYALADGPMNFAQATNCSKIDPLTRLLSRSGVKRKQFRREARAAFDAWEAAANIRFTEVSNPLEADIVIGAQRIPRGRAFANVAFQPARDQKGPFHTISKALICLNPVKPWKVGFDGDADVYDLRFTLSHEIGHAIGLNHAGSKVQLMGFRYHERFRGPQRGDVAGAALLYGTAKTRVTAGAEEKFASPAGRSDRSTPPLSLQ